MYDHTTPYARAESAERLLEEALLARAGVDARWSLLADYYNGDHRTAKEIESSFTDAGIPWIPAFSCDPYVHVESQITPSLPEFELRGRDDDLDSEKAFQRERVVRFILDENRVEDSVPSAERRCIMTGTAVWKVFWDGGDVRVVTVDARNVYPDPRALDENDCEYITLVNFVPLEAFRRRWGDISDIPAEDGLVKVLEHWFRNEDGKISFSTVCGGRELSFVPDYWLSTGADRFPFVFQRRMSDPDSIWGRTELESILTLVDAVDRELSVAQLNGAFYGADIILAENDAFCESPKQQPGALWRLKPGAIDKIKRLGGLGSISDRLSSVEALRSLIQESVGNYDIDMGKEPSRMLSATGLAQLIERAEIRRAPKKAERLLAYRRLYSLIDLTALEFYVPGKIVFLGAAKSEREVFTYDPQKLLSLDPGGKSYFPKVDTVVYAADGLTKSKAFTLSALDTLLGHSITPENHLIVGSLLKLLDLPENRDICEYLGELFAEEVKNDG